MKLLSTCERQFVSNCVIKKQKRIDGRQLLEGRKLEIAFAKERGCCMVLQGNTRILAHVSCDVTEPKASTPTEGILHVNLELSPMASPDAKSQLRSSEEAVVAQRSLERCIRDSKCIDLESLCIVTGSKVWTIRVDVHALNDDGNLTECASIAAIAALAHFRRPDVTVIGIDITVHSLEDREPVALNLHHMPLSVNLALFDQGKHILVDPTDLEEKISDGCYIIGMNAHQEICFSTRRGVLLLKLDNIQRCQDIAVKRAQEVTQTIRTALDDDSYKRLTSAPIGFTHLIQTETILGGKRQLGETNFNYIKALEDNKEPDVELSENNAEESFQTSADGNKTSPVKSSAARARAMQILQNAETSIFEGGPSKWGIESNNESSSEEEMSEELKPNVPSFKEEINLDSEEETVYVDEDQIDMKTQETRGWYSKDPFM